MTETTKSQVIEIDGKEFKYDEMSQEQQTLVQHVVDLDRKLANMQFQLDQIRVGKDAFLQLLKQSLAEPAAQAE